MPGTVPPTLLRSLGARPGLEVATCRSLLQDSLVLHQTVLVPRGGVDLPSPVPRCSSHSETSLGSPGVLRLFWMGGRTVVGGPRTGTTRDLPCLWFSLRVTLYPYLSFGVLSCHTVGGRASLPAVSNLTPQDLSSSLCPTR